MKIAPEAKIDDGLIDLLLFTSTAPKDLLAVLRRFYNGTHIDLPHVHYIKAKKFTITPYKPATDGSESGGEEGRRKAGERRNSQQSDDDDTSTDVEAKTVDWFDDETMEVMKEVIDIDGELKGFTPFTCEVLPRALQVIL
jgi:diacylglycerol kinase family enzyme